MNLFTFMAVAVVAVWLFYQVGLSNSKQADKDKNSGGGSPQPQKASKHTDKNRTETAGVTLNLKDFNARIYSVEWRLPNRHDFEVHNTPAAIMWAKGDDKVEVIVNKSFVDGVAQSPNFDNYCFSIKDDMWLGPAPRGSASVCKAEIKSLLSL